MGEIEKLDYAELDAGEARRITDQIRANIETLWELIQQAYHGRAWTALGYSSWSDYCAEEFGSSRLRLPREERAEAASMLRESGLSLRAIAAATGNDVKTIRDDLARVGISHTSAITGTDGKTYPSTPSTAPDTFTIPDTIEGVRERLEEIADEEEQLIAAIPPEELAKFMEIEKRIEARDARIAEGRTEIAQLRYEREMVEINQMPQGWRRDAREFGAAIRYQQARIRILYEWSCLWSVEEFLKQIGGGAYERDLLLGSLEGDDGE
jgi:hypothetical protein